MDIGVQKKYYRELSIKERDECKKAFRKIDTNHDGRLAWTELLKASTLLGMKLTEKQARKMVKEFDNNGDGFIDYKEFERLMSKNPKPIFLIDDEDEVLKNAFNRFDLDGNGSITEEELEKALLSMGIDSAKTEAKQMIAEADENGDGVITFDEFARCVSQF